MSNVEVRWIDPTDIDDIEVTHMVYNYLLKKGINVQKRRRISDNEIEIQVLTTIPIDFEIRIFSPLENGRQVILKEEEIKITHRDTSSLDPKEAERVCFENQKCDAALEICKKAFKEIQNYFVEEDILVASAIMWCGYDEKGTIYLASDITPVMLELLDIKTRKPFPSNDEIYSRLLG